MSLVPAPPIEQLLQLHRNTGPMARAYIHIRLRNFPNGEFWPMLAQLKGTVLTVGAGYGLFETMVAMVNPDVFFIASDIDARRIAYAQRAARGIRNIRFDVLDLTREFPAETVNTVLMLDVLHHLSPEVQQSVVLRACELVPRGGNVIIKECGTFPRWKCWFNYLNDAIGSPGEKTWPQSEQHWAATMAKGGLKTETRRLDKGSPYAHILIIGEKP